MRTAPCTPRVITSTKLASWTSSIFTAIKYKKQVPKLSLVRLYKEKTCLYTGPVCAQYVFLQDFFPSDTTPGTPVKPPCPPPGRESRVLIPGGNRMVRPCFRANWNKIHSRWRPFIRCLRAYTLYIPVNNAPVKELCSTHEHSQFFSRVNSNPPSSHICFCALYGFRSP